MARAPHRSARGRLSPATSGRALLVGQSFEVWRDPLASALARGDLDVLVAQARGQLAAGAAAIDVNAGAAGDATTLVTAAQALRAALPGVPLWLDSGELEAIVAALEAVPGPLVANAAPLRGGGEAVVEAAARTGAGVVLTPRLADYSGTATIEELLFVITEGRHLAERAGAGLDGAPIYLDALAFPPAHDRGLALRSIGLLRALHDETALRPLVAVGNVGHGAPARVRSALRRVYAALAFGAGAEALIVPLEDRPLVSLLRVLAGDEPASSEGQGWLEGVRDATRLGERLPAPPASAGAPLLHAWALLQGRP